MKKKCFQVGNVHVQQMGAACPEHRALKPSGLRKIVTFVEL